MKLKSKKSALLLSFTSLLLCFAMLAGSTFAWFTDTATTGVNQIKSGTLDVGLEMATAWDGQGNPTAWDNAEGKTLEFVKAAGAAENEAVLWEPNCTYKLPELRVVNKGNLALKYKVEITGIKGDAKLNKVIKWTIVEGAEANAIKENEVPTGEYFLLPAGATTAPLTIEGHMDQNAGNEYQNLTIDGIGITVLATQYTYENDSKDDQYDKDAPVVEVTPANAQDVLDKLDGYATVKLGAGTYDTLYLRPVKGNANTALKDGVANYRTITGLTIVGADGVTVQSIKVGSDVNLSNDDFVQVNDLTIQNVTFTSDSSTNGFETTTGRSAVNGITMDGCKMTAGEGFVQSGDEGNLYKSKIHVSNVVIKNCEVNGIHRLATFDTVTNATIEGNKIDKVTGHGIHFGTATADGIDGALVIKDNSADGLTCRFLRMDRVAPTASVNISGNAVTNYNNPDDFGFTDGNDQGSGRYYSVDYMKVTNVAAGASVTISGNTLNVATSYGSRLTYIRVNSTAYQPDGTLVFTDIDKNIR